MPAPIFSIDWYRCSGAHRAATYDFWMASVYANIRALHSVELMTEHCQSDLHPRLVPLALALELVAFGFELADDRLRLIPVCKLLGAPPYVQFQFVCSAHDAILQVSSHSSSPKGAVCYVFHDEEIGQCCALRSGADQDSQWGPGTGAELFPEEES